MAAAWQQRFAVVVVAVAGALNGDVLAGGGDAGTNGARATLPLTIRSQEQASRLPNGVAGRLVAVQSANPRNYEEILQGRRMPPVALDAMLFLPVRKGRVPAVVMVPGSGGANSSLLAHANALTNANIAVLILDPFGGRGIRDTIAAQDQMSFAASAYDVLAAVRALDREAAIDAGRIGVMGYSRGGHAALQASVTALANAVLGPGRQLRAVLAAWPWCGLQFADPRTEPAAVRYLLADSDDWVNPVQCQAYFSAMKTHNPAVSLRLFKNANHGFGYDFPLQELPQAVKALNAPIAYYDERGVLHDPWSGQALPGADDRSVAELFGRFIARGVRVGTRDHQMAEFVSDVVAFFKAQLSP